MLNAMPRSRATFTVLLLLALTGPGDLLRAGAEAPLEPQHLRFLEDHELLLSDAERASFRALGSNYRRDAFIEQFWRERDPYPDTARNEAREIWRERISIVRALFGSPSEPRARMWLTTGEPDERHEVYCSGVTWPLEAWFYQGLIREGDIVTRHPTALVFVQRWRAGKYRLWMPAEGTAVLLDDSDIGGVRSEHCGWPVLEEALETIRDVGRNGGSYDQIIERFEAPPEPPGAEWVETFDSYSTEVDPARETIEVDATFDYPATRQSRVLVRGTVTVEAEDLASDDIAGQALHHVLLVGEVLRADREAQKTAVGESGITGSGTTESGTPERLHDSFRYRFRFEPRPPRGAAEREAPSSVPLASSDPDAGDRLPLVFERYLRPGVYRLRLRVDDLLSSVSGYHDQVIVVPGLREVAPPSSSAAFGRAGPDEAGSDEAGPSSESIAQRAPGEETFIEIVPPRGDLMTAFHRFETRVGGNVAKVVFALDGRVVLEKRAPPFSVDLDLGDLPRLRTLTATGLDSNGRVVAIDRLDLNAAPHRFDVDLVEPLPGAPLGATTRLRASVTQPTGREVERVEFSVDASLVATVSQPPFMATVDLRREPLPEALVVSAVAVLDDGSRREAVRVISGSGRDLGVEQIDVDLVELYTTVLDRGRRPVFGLAESDFAVFEDGEPQTIRRFESDATAPLVVTLLLDISASMQPHLEAAADAAIDFFRTVRRPGDRVSALLFNDRLRIATELTQQPEQLERSLSGLVAERGTALFDSLVEALHRLNGLSGQKVLILLSDGVDEHSKYTLEQTLDFARHSEVTIYALALDLPPEGKAKARQTLQSLSRETGGQSFVLDSREELVTVYSQISEQLRARYLLVYQSTNDSDDEGLRQIEVEVARRGVTARTLRGYYP